ncbi:DUF6531 domain-containing protein [Streptomyces sp. NPDC002784]
MPGDPQQVRQLAKKLHDFADDVSDALRLVKGMAGEGTLAEWAGKSADVFKEDFADVPKNLKKLKSSYELCGDALADYWPKLERAQALADRALARGREARSDLASAKSRLSTADSWVTRAGKEAGKYKDDPTGSKAADKPDEAKVRAATRDVQQAETAQATARGDVADAQGALDAAKKMAEDARKMREEAARTAKTKIDEASDAGIQNRSWWEDIGDWFVDNWDTIVAVCKVVVAVVGVIAMIIGGPILAAIVIVAGLIVLADSLYKYSKGQAGLLDVGLAALDCIPGMKGLTSLGKLAMGMKALGKGGLKAMAKGLGKKGLRKEADDAVAHSKPTKGRCKNGDPIDMISGDMLMEERDVDLPGLLPLVLRRTHLSSYPYGRCFGPSWASTLDERLELDDEGAVFATEDGMLLFYPVPTPGTSVLPLEGPRLRLDWDGAPGAPVRITDPLSGITRHFAPRRKPAAPDEAFTLPLAAITDRNGLRIDFDRDDDGTPVAVRDSAGRHLYVDTADGRVTALRLHNPEDGPDGTLLRRFGYDAQGNLGSIHNSSGQPRKLTYDARTRITSWTDRNGYSYRFTYDALDRCTAGEGDDGSLSCTVEYDSENRETRYTDALGNTTTYRYNEQLQLVAETDPLGHTNHSEWDRYGRMLSRTDELGRTTRFTLGEHGEPVRMDRPDGTSIHVEYDAEIQPVAIVEPDGARWECAYDDRGNLLSSTDPLGALSSYTYDTRGHRIAQTDALGNTFRFDTDGTGLPVRVVDPRGSVAVVHRDAYGRVVRIDDPVGGSVRQGWNPEGLLLWRERADGSRESWSYDAEGNLTEHQEPGGFTTAFEYGAFDLPSARTDPDGTRYVFTHDAELRLTAVTNPQGGAWRYRYDAAGHLIAETDYNGRTVTYAYDPAGYQIERTNGTGQTVRVTRDAAGRAVTTQTDTGAVTSLRYDASGRMVEAVNADSSVAYAYDAVGRIVAETADGRTVTSEYDALGRRIRRTTPSGAVSQWSYDSAGLPASLVTAAGELTFTYDAAGRETARGLGGAATLTQSWDAGHRLVEQIIQSRTGVDGSGSGTPAVRQSRAYAYRADGHLTAITDRLSGTRRFDLDRAGRVTRVTADTWTESYAYDELGNLTTAEHPAPDGQDAQGPAQHAGTKVSSAGRTSYEHDAQGRVSRVIRRTLSGLRRVWTYVWDAEDRLTEAVTPDNGVWRYRYDALGRRTAKARVREDGSLTDEVLFTWDCANLAEQQTLRDGVLETDTWDWEPGTHRAAAQVRSRFRTPEEIDRQFYAIVTDLVGTPTELVDEDGEIAWRSATSLWGRPLPDSGEALCPLAFPGQYRDAETGLHYNLARYYDPDTASYLSPDPLGLAPAPNHHGYVDNPFRWSDPLGLEEDAKEPTRVYDDSEYSKHGSGSSSSAKGEVSRAPSNGQAALDRSIDMDPNNPNVTRRLGVDHANNEIVVLDRHREILDKDGNVVKEIYHGHVQSSYPSKSVTQGDLTKLKKAGMIDNVKKQRVLPPPPCDD